MSVQYVVNRIIPHRSNNTVSTEVGNGEVKSSLTTATLQASNETTVVWHIHEDSISAFLTNLNTNYNSIFSLTVSGHDPFQTGTDTNNVKIIGGIDQKRIRETFWEIAVRYRLQ